MSSQEGDILEKQRETIRVLCCNECIEPLELNEKQLRICPECGIMPPPNAVFIKRICPECNIQVNETTSGQYVCPFCGQIYTN